MIILGIDIPFYIQMGIKPNHKGYKEKNLITCDTETYKGKPLTLQLYNDDDEPRLYFRNEKNITRQFCVYLDQFTMSRWGKKQNVLYFHNLVFDMVEILYPKHKMFKDNEFTVKCYGWTFQVFHGKSAFVKARKGNTSILMVDSWSFLKSSLMKLADEFEFEYKKLQKPKLLGSYKYTKRNKNFCEYAKQDVLIQHELATVIDNMHDEFDLSQTISIADMASRIFRHKFLKHTIKFPPSLCVRFSLLSYHGGKNAFYVEPKFYKDIKIIDINSAYPHAMTFLPSFEDGEYIFVKGGRKKKFNGVGVYKVWCNVKDTKYGLVFNEKYKRCSGKVIWFCTGWELKTAIENNLLTVIQYEGYIWEGKVSKINPFVEFVEYFYSRKSESSKSKRMFYKTIMNSLYGKFIQRTKDVVFDDDLNEFIVERAGGMFNPFIASLITGFVRAELYKLEVKYKSMHTSTDSLITKTKNPLLTNEIGGLSLESEGDILLLRTRLYVLMQQGKITKFVSHGYKGTAQQLIDMHKTGVYEYEAERMTKVKESIIQGIQVNEFRKISAKLNL